MNSALSLLSTEDLQKMAGALRAGRLRPPFSSLVLRRYVPGTLAEQVTIELRGRFQGAGQPENLACLLEVLIEDRIRRPVAEDRIDLVWTGPEAPGVLNRDTSVVVRELFQGAKESVIVAGYAIYQGRVVFKALADRMEDNPRLSVHMFFNIQRPPHDDSSPSDLVREFAERFARQEWPGRLLPKLYYDPRSLENESTKRASLHAKCIVVDKLEAFVSSANFTEAAQTKNIEVGVLVHSRVFAQKLAAHFEMLYSSKLVKPLRLSP
jgi:phosphatidylserine/phosphatidylglycerophosphate/cardiolipin synthase-like enzyme